MTSFICLDSIWILRDYGVVVFHFVFFFIPLVISPRVVMSDAQWLVANVPNFVDGVIKRVKYALRYVSCLLCEKNMMFVTK